jgi:hypothetical protein
LVQGTPYFELFRDIAFLFALNFLLVSQNNVGQYFVTVRHSSFLLTMPDSSFLLSRWLMMNCKLSGPKGWLQCANSNNRVKGIQVRYISLTVLLDSELHFNILQAAQKQEDERKQQEDMKNSILSQVLNQSARARCNN